MKSFFFLLSILVLLNWSCTNSADTPTDSKIPDFVLAGGLTTHFDLTSNAFSTPAPNLSAEDLEKHLDGDRAFDQIFVTGAAEVNGGLGPIFNNNACVSCHVKNGRAASSLDGNELSGLLLRISISGESAKGGPNPVPLFGGQLQNKSVYGKMRESNFTATETTKTVELAGGETVILRKPIYQLTESYVPLPSGVMISARVAPSVFGLGLLDVIPTADILKNEDIEDSNGDGISGKANSVWNVLEKKKTIGKFGWKAESPSVRQQSAEAYQQDMGITNSLFSEENCNGQSNCEEQDNRLDITDKTLDETVFYVETLAVPATRNYNTTNFKEGQQLFEKIECVLCHIPKSTTGTSEIASLSNQTIFPYTDLLLHDMGEGLADNRPSFLANGKEWRTAPLWGIGMQERVNNHTRFLHDGRARNIQEAILWHDGESKKSKDEYVKLSKTKRENLLYFLNSL